MAIYFFDVTGGDQSCRDDIGVSLPSFDDVRRRVGEMIADLAIEEFAERPSSHFHLSVRDEADFVIFDADIACRTTLRS